jgi:hypothetical protein
MGVFITSVNSVRFLFPLFFLDELHVDLEFVSYHHFFVGWWWCEDSGCC